MKLRTTQFIGKNQRAAINSGLQGEEKQYFSSLLQSVAETINTMPKTYEQDGLGRKAVAYLHYFVGGNDWYITERDMEPEQSQAFGVVSLNGHEPETGYISIEELVQHNVELDLHFTPTQLDQII